MERAMTCGEILEAIGSLAAALKIYASKLPRVVNLTAIPGGLKPKPEAIDAYEQEVHRIRRRTGTTPYRRFNDLFIESLEAFESGNLLAAIQPLLAVLDHLESLHRDKEITATAAEEKRMAEYRTALTKILPGNQPELEGAGKGMGT